MIEARALSRHYKAVRNRLRNPPNAVPDTAIDLKIKKIIVPVRKPKLEVRFLYSYIFILGQLYEPMRHQLRLCFHLSGLKFPAVLNFVAEEFGMSHDQIRQRSRIPFIVLPRQIAFYLTYKNKIQTTLGMGRHLGLDHSSVVHGKTKVRDMMIGSSLCRVYIDALEVRLLADFNRLTVPAECQSHLDRPKRQGNAEVRQISPVDNSGRSNLRDAEEGPR